MTFPQRIERLVAERRLEAAQFDDREIVGLWTRALASYRDAGVAGLSDEGAFTRAYDAGREAATTLLAALGLRVRGQAHHYTVFYAVAALEEPAVSEFGVELESVRQSRHMAVYEVTADSATLRADREKLKEMLTRLFPAAHAWLMTRRPSLLGGSSRLLDALCSVRQAGRSAPVPEPSRGSARGSCTGRPIRSSGTRTGDA